MKHHFSSLFRLVSMLFLIFSSGVGSHSERCRAQVATGSTPAADGRLQAGAAVRNIDPTHWPVWVSGGIVAAKGERVIDSLYARSLVLENQGQSVAICVVDSLAVPASIVDRAKELVAEAIGIPADHILISATHAHSAPSVMGAHGTPVQEDYAASLPSWIAESIVEAHRRRQPARLGTTVTNADRFIHCRHWIMEPGHAGGVLFSGRDSNIAMMNPGHDNPFKIRQTNDVDRTIPILSVQSQQGRPIAVLASFCTHYAGAPAISSDYFGVVAKELASQLSPDDPNAFVGIMANGTSGDANCIDFSRPAKPFNHRDVGHYVAQRILDALPNIAYQDSVGLDGALEKLPLKIRQADAEELQQATAYIESRMKDRLPANMEENYARETVLLSQWPSTREIPIQAIRIGDMVIAGYPNETFNDTGLAVRSKSPFAATMNIGMANDYAGYLPPAPLFPLGGYTTWRARTSCLEVGAEAEVVQGLRRLIQSMAAKHWKGWARANQADIDIEARIVRHDGPDTAVPPNDSLSTFVLDPLQRIELAASEPQLIDPVAIRFDDAGDLWVVEMSDYPNPIDSAKPTGRIRVLRDQDLDGRFETSRVFADGLLMPTGLQFHRDGVLVTVGGELWFLRDSDGDGQSDERQIWLQGFAAENPQLRVNDPDFGLDQQLYLANGLRSGRFTSGDQSVSIGSSDVRMDVRTRKGEAITGPSQFGMSWDRFGNRYFCSNRNPCDAVLLESEFAARSPLAGLAPMTEPVLPPGERSTVRPLVQAWTTSNLHAGQFTAACGLLISDSRQLPAASLGQALTCEPTGSLVHRVGLGRVAGKTIAEEPARDREWLASTDPWFRPVNLEEGPEGGIYIVDMHRAVIEHPDWVPEELKHRTDERWGDQSGRIYRVVRQDAPRIDPIFQALRSNPLRNRTSSELVDALNASNEWVRKTAARILSERDDPEIEPMLLEFARRNTHSPGFLRGVYLLNDRGAWDRGLMECMTEWLGEREDYPHAVTDPTLRAALWRIYPSTDSYTLGLMLEVHRTIAEGTREELIACLQSAPDGLSMVPGSLDAAVARACESADDPHALLALSAYCRNHLPKFTITFMELAEKKIEAKQMVTNIHWPSVRKWVSLTAKPDDPKWIQARDAWLANALARQNAPIPTEADRRSILEPQLRLSWAIAQGIAESPDRVWLGKQSELWERWASWLASDQLSQTARSELIELLGQNLSPEQSARCAKALREWLTADHEPSVMRRGIAAWSKHDDPDLTKWLLSQYPIATSNVRSELFAAIRARPERLTAWLEGTERGELSVQLLDASQLQSLRQIEGPLQSRIQPLIAGRIQTNRQQLIDRYATQLDGKGQRERGKQLFAQHCAACHRIDGVGVNIGPDISDSRTQTPMQLLVSILDPNRAIDNNYFRVTVLMKDGTVHDGIVIEESSQHLALKNANQPSIAVSKSELESVKASGMSLMPEGIEAQLDPQAMADLVSYIKNWRYAGGESPSVK
jgi:putative membrane-bound dehydrogenase-like protein